MKTVEVNGRTYQVKVGYWLQPYFQYLSKLNNGAASLDQVGKNADEIESLIKGVLGKAVGEYEADDETGLFNSLVSIFTEEVRNTPNLGVRGRKR